MLSSDKVISLPYKVYGKGIYAIDVTTAEGKNLPFIIDTGATRSAIFKSTLRQMGIEPSDNSIMNIHGISDKAFRPVATIPSMMIGTKIFTNHAVAVLEERKLPVEQSINPRGLIGMDILSDYRLFVDSETRTFNLIPRSLPAPKIPYKWETVELYTNPFVDQDHDLHFMKIRLGNHLLPALLDMGSEDNMMNWSVSKFPQLKRVRKKLYETWIVEGAVGTFDPLYRIKTRNIRSGQKFWDSTDFLVMDFDGLEILGIDNQPFLIAGSSMFSEQTFYLDFADNFMRFKPKQNSVRAKSLTVTNTVYRDKARAE